MPKLPEAEKTRRRAVRDANRKAKDEERKFAERQKAQLLLAFANSGGQKMVDLMPSFLVGTAGMVVIGTPRAAAELLALPISPLGSLKISGPGFALGFDLAAYKLELASSIAQLFHGDPGAIDKEIPIQGRLAIGGLLTYSAQLTREIFSGISGDVVRAIGEAVPG